MKTKITILVAAIFSINFAFSQCSAVYSYSVSPANDGSAAFTITTPLPNNFIYFWNFSDGTGSNQLNPSHTFSTGTWYVCLTATDSSNNLSCTFCDSVRVINTNGGSTCSANFSVQDSSGYVFAYDMTTGSNLSYYWNFGDSTVSYASGSQVHQYAQSGTYTICLTISNSFLGCSDTYCANVTINLNGNNGSCLGIVNPQFSSSISGDTASFSNTPTGLNQVYYWDFGDGNHSNTNGSVSHIYGQSGTYPVCCTVYEISGGNDSCQYCSSVTIPAQNTCSAAFVIYQDSLNLYNYTVYNYASGPFANTLLTYFWDFGDGTTSTLAYPSHTYTGVGPYNICLTITGGGCTATYCDSILPGHSPSQNTTLNVIDPSLSVGVNTHSESIESLENYPNPFSDLTTINYSLKQNSTIELSIFDLLGNKVKNLESGNKSAGKHSLAFTNSEIEAGIYLLQLKVNNQISSKKLIITK